MSLWRSPRLFVSPARRPLFSFQTWVALDVSAFNRNICLIVRIKIWRHQTYAMKDLLNPGNELLTRENNGAVWLTESLYEAPHIILLSKFNCSKRQVMASKSMSLGGSAPTPFSVREKLVDINWMGWSRHSNASVACGLGGQNNTVCWLALKP